MLCLPSPSVVVLKFSFALLGRVKAEPVTVTCLSARIEYKQAEGRGSTFDELWRTWAKTAPAARINSLAVAFSQFTRRKATNLQDESAWTTPKPFANCSERKQVNGGNPRLQQYRFFHSIEFNRVTGKLSRNNWIRHPSNSNVARRENWLKTEGPKALSIEHWRSCLGLRQDCFETSVSNPRRQKPRGFSPR